MINITIIFQALFFILPAGIANMFPVLCRRIPLPFSSPINEALFGKNKTRKGLYCGVVGAMLTIVLQIFLLERGVVPFSYSLIEYSLSTIIPYGFLFGLSALIGDLIESYVKRRKGFPPGKAWFPWDQIDWVVATILFTLPFYTLSWSHIGVLVIVVPLLHAITNVIGYLLGLKDVRW